MFPQTAIFPSASIFQFQHGIFFLSIQIFFFFPFLGRQQVEITDEIRVQGNHFRLEFVEEGFHLAFLSLFPVLVRVQFQGVEIGFAGAGDDDAGEAAVVRDAEDVFEGTPFYAFDVATVGAPVHVGGMHFFLIVDVFVEEAFPDGDLGAPADADEVAVADGEGGAGLAEEVIVDFFRHAEVPDGHGFVLAGGAHVAAFSVDGDGADGTAVGEHFHEGGCGVGGPEGYGAVLVAHV